MGFKLDCKQQDRRTVTQRGVSVTDLKWRALGRRWLGSGGEFLELSQDGLLTRLNAEALYLTVGLSRKWQGEYWPLVHAVHVVPDYAIMIDPTNL
jgi:hypothetical protein